MSVAEPPRLRVPMIEPPAEPPVIAPGHTSASVTDKISSVVFGKMPLWFYVAMAIAFGGAMMLLTALTKLVFTGIGIWGNNQPVGWGFDIINFVWWIGIGHAGTLISAILLLLRQEWRTSINRFAEAMTLFAVACALLYPLFHTGRPWLAVYWLLPYPNTMAIWPNFRSPLIWDVFAVVCAAIFPVFHVGRIWYAWFLFPIPNYNYIWQNFRSPLEWDVFAVSTYGTVSVLFWYIGLIPDLAVLRDRFFAAGNKFRVRQYSGAINKARNQRMRDQLWQDLLLNLARDLVPYRPNRLEPRVVKRRPKNFGWLTKPRHQYRECLHRNRYWRAKPRVLRGLN